MKRWGRYNIHPARVSWNRVAIWAHNFEILHSNVSRGARGWGWKGRSLFYSHEVGAQSAGGVAFSPTVLPFLSLSEVTYQSSDLFCLYQLLHALALMYLQEGLRGELPISQSPAGVSQTWMIPWFRGEYYRTILFWLSIERRGVTACSFWAFEGRKHCSSIRQGCKRKNLPS